jgi:hypothetical protein
MVRSLERVNEVLDALAAGQVVGRAVVDVAGVTAGAQDRWSGGGTASPFTA